jgi:hypothetical protein
MEVNEKPTGSKLDTSRMGRRIEEKIGEWQVSRVPSVQACRKVYNHLSCRYQRIDRPGNSHVVERRYNQVLKENMCFAGIVGRGDQCEERYGRGIRV